MPMCGSVSQACLISYHSLLSLKTASSAFTVVFHQVLTLWIRSNSLIGSWKCHMKAQYVICYGLIQMTDAAGVSLQEVLVTRLDKIYLSNSITQMI